MDKRGVFLKFLKLHGEIPSVRERFYSKNPKIWMMDDKTVEYRFKSVKPNVFFDFYLNKYGFIRGFQYIMTEIDTQIYSRLYDKWKYFIKNNVYLNPKIFSADGLYIRLPYRFLTPCKIIENKGSHTLAEVTVNDCVENFSVNSDEIFLQDGKRADLDYYLKVRGKKYGLE